MTTPPVVDIPRTDQGLVAQILALLKDGGEVAMASAPGGIRRSHRLVAVLEKTKLVATGAIKAPEATYIASLANKSGCDMATMQRELGYVATAPSHRQRGLASQITSTLVHGEGRLFATTNDTNSGMHKILARQGFKKVGKSWPSDQNLGTTVSLWFREVAT